MSSRKLPLPSRRAAASRVAAFNPALPEDHALIVASVLRDQFTGLQQLIAQVPVVNGAAVESVGSVPPEDPATASVRLAGGELLFNFAIPRGYDGQQGQPGDPGAQGPPFANAVVDGTSTLPPDEPAQVSSWFDGNTVHLYFAIPQGYNGPEGPQGPPGEVTTAQMDEAISAAIQGTARNPEGVQPLQISISDPPTQSEVQQILDKLNELIAALYRTP